ncbi:cytochrome P450 [Xylaria grammica]|nr:cytochrome P450 [Xylaria grammica]
MLFSLAFFLEPPAAQWLVTLASLSVVSWLAGRCAWRLFLHPLSRYPGPKLAAISDVWFAYHALAGRWPFAVDDAMRKYGDVVRIAPNELVFMTPQALSDIYGSHEKNCEIFPKTQINNHGNDEHGGLIWEWDPLRHRRVAKQMAPGFSGRALKAKEPTLHRYIDLFIEHMEILGNRPEGVNLPTWINWLCVDISADMAYNRQMNALKDMKEPPYLSILSGSNIAIVIIQMSWRFPLLSPLKFLFLYLAGLRSHSDIRNHSRQLLEQRIRRSDAVEHVDFFAQLVPQNHQPPSDRREMRHLEQIAGQLLVAGYEPPALWFYFTIYHLLQSPDQLDVLSAEIRAAFRTYGDITPATSAQLPFLTACLKESLRLMPGTLTGMPVVSPGAMVDGHIIPKGVICQSSSFSMARSPRYFADPSRFRPERWLPEKHPLYDSQFTDDNRKGFYPFSQGPRVCAGKEIAWWQSRLFLAKIIWKFNVHMIPGQLLNMDRDLKGWAMYVKPDLRVRFTPVMRKTGM